MAERIGDIWQLDLDWQEKDVEVVNSGMTVVTCPSDKISVGYSSRDRLENLRLISAAPELLRLVKLANRIINEKEPREHWKYDFNELFECAMNKVNGEGKLRPPNHAIATYEWTDEHIQRYHEKVKNLEHKL